jgi:hypothetical protein
VIKFSHIVENRIPLYGANYRDTAREFVVTDQAHLSVNFTALSNLFCEERKLTIVFVHFGDWQH